MMHNFIIRFSLIFLIFNVILYSQNLADRTLKKSDTLSTRSSIKKSPTKAMLFSAVIPGSGQFYNQSYWKIPVILGLAAYWGYEWQNLNKNYKTYRDLYSKSLATLPPYGNYQYKLIRDFYRTERDKFAWYLGILYVANILDAYVDANLFEFDVGDDLSIKISEDLRENLTVRIFLNIKW